MALSRNRFVLIMVLLILGLYLTIFHTEPFPFNHESVGLGANHLLHIVFGVIFVAASVFLWFTRKKGKK